jgi:hypothetical protein
MVHQGDAADAAYDGCVGSTTNYNTWGGVNPGVIPWQATAPNAGTATPVVRTNYGSTARSYFMGWCPSGTWATVAVSATDILTQTTENKAWFVPCPLLGHTKGEGFVIKLRQVAWGPGTVGAFTAYNTTGPVVQARQFCQTTVGQNGCPWLTNFKI